MGVAQTADSNDTLVLGMQELDASNVLLINALLSVVVRPEIVDNLNSLKRRPRYIGRGYRLCVLDGLIEKPPEVLSAKSAGLPARGEATGYVLSFDCEVLFESSQSLRIKLESMHSMRPNIYADIRSFRLRARVHIETSPGLGYMVWYFLSKPHVVWDMEATFTDSKHDLFGENLVPAFVLEPLLGSITKDAPRLAEFSGALFKHNHERYHRLRKMAIQMALPNGPWGKQARYCFGCMRR